MSLHLFISFVTDALVGPHHVLADSVGADPAGQAALVDVFAGCSVLRHLQPYRTLAVEGSCEQPASESRTIQPKWIYIELDSIVWLN